MRTLLLTISLACALTLSGCIAESDPDLANSDDEANEAIDATLGPITEELAGNTGNSVATPALTVSNGDGYEFPLPQTVNVTGWVLEVVWDANGPESETLDLWLRKAGDYAIPPNDPTVLTDNQPTLKATGPSPLRMAVNPAALDGVDHTVLVRASSPAGAALEQAFTLHLTTFEDIDFDDTYSALE